MNGELEGFEGQLPHMGDWADHMTTNFPEVRLKKYLEMRGTDGGPWRNLCALPALWVGLLYDPDSQSAAWDLIKDWSIEEQEILRNEVPIKGLTTPFRKTSVQEISKEILAIASAGLKKRAKLDPSGNDESGFLETLRDIAERGRTPAEELLEAFSGKWSKSVSPIFEELQY